MTEQQTKEQNSHARWLRLAAEDIRKAGHNGWGNTCEWAADEIDLLEKRIAELEARLEKYA